MTRIDDIYVEKSKLCWWWKLGLMMRESQLLYDWEIFTK